MTIRFLNFELTIKFSLMYKETPYPISKETLKIILDYLKEGRVIPAVKEYKSKTNSSLLEAKTSVEAIGNKYGYRKNDQWLRFNT